MGQIEDSATLSVMGTIKGLIAQGVDIINLTAGEPDFSPPQCVNDAAIKAIQDGMGRSDFINFARRYGWLDPLIGLILLYFFY